MKYLLSFIFISSVFLASAQQNSNPWEFTAPAILPSISNKTEFLKPDTIAISPVFNDSANNPTPVQQQSDLRGFNSVLIGTTYLDLQTNASICNSIFRQENGKISAVWNFAPVPDVDLSTRGTGYNYFNGSSWQPLPTLRIEDTKTGWPNIVVTDSNQEYILCHNLQTGGMQFNFRDTTGTGQWTEQQGLIVAPNLYGMWWPRIVRGGTFGGDFLHAIALTLPTSHGGIPYLGMDGALLYYRSTDNGETWDKVNILIDGIDSTQYARIRPDNYAMDDNQNNLAIVTGGIGNDIVLLTSQFNGSTWTKTIVQDFPIDTFYDQISDTSGDGVADVLETNDGSLAVLIDNSGTVHVWAGYMQMINSDSTDNTLSFYPTSNGILYWNTDMVGQPMKKITGALDYNYNGVLDVSTYGFFNTGFASFPSAGIDANGNIYLSYSAIYEPGKDSDNKTVRHTYLISSPDGGNTWSYPYDLVPDQNAEGVFGSLARVNDDNIRMIYQKDFCSGLGTMAGFPDPCNISKSSDIVYVEAPALEVLNNVGIEETEFETLSRIYPNPSNGVFTFSLPLFQSQKVSLSVYDLNGRVVYENESTLTSESVDLSFLPAGLYAMKVQSENSVFNSKICIAK